MLNLFVGVVIDTFSNLRDDNGGVSPLMTPEQVQWLRVQSLMVRTSPASVRTPYLLPRCLRPLSSDGTSGSQPLRARANDCCQSLRARAYVLVRWRHFDNMITFAIIVNTCWMGSRHFGETHAAMQLAERANFGFAMLFTAEAVAKLLAVGWKQYVRSGWHRFDLGVVIATDLGLLVGAGPLATAARVLRLGRVVRLLHRAPQLHVLFRAVVATVPSLMNITSLLLLFYFIFATLGMQLFATVRFDGELDEHANFRTFGSSMLTLFRSSTGEAWNNIMHAVAAVPPGCVSSPEYDARVCGFEGAPLSPACVPLNGCGQPTWAYAFFAIFEVRGMASSCIFPFILSVPTLSFSAILRRCAASPPRWKSSAHPLHACYPWFVPRQITIGFIFVNLFVGVILDGFDVQQKRMDAETANRLVEREEGEAGLDENE